MLLYHQHMSWLNDCWVGVTTLRKRLNWSATRVRDSLRAMFDKNRWYELHPTLQRPLKCELVKNTNANAKRPRRRFTVRAVYYDGTGKNRILRISKAFEKGPFKKSSTRARFPEGSLIQ
jgi:hypothetical protein